MDIQKTGLNLFLVAEGLLLIAVLVFALFSTATGAIKDKTKDTENSQVSENTGAQDNWVSTEKNSETETEDKEELRWSVPEDYTESRVTFSAAVEAKLASMSIEQKVAQLFIVSPEALNEHRYEKVTVFGNSSKEAFDKYPVGGLVYGALNFQNIDQTKALLKGAKDYSLQQYGITLFTAIEEEGGANNSPLATALLIDRVSSASELGNQGLVAVQQAAGSRVNYVKSAEFNLLLSTIADVSSALDTAYSLRTFGTDVNIVADMVAADIQAIENAGVGATLKYFPGKADATADATGILSSSQTLEELCNRSLISYQAGIDAGASYVMIGNVIVPSITDDENVPCCLSGRTVGLLRESMGFDGVLITDNFSEEGFVSVYGGSNACVEAIKAGIDMIYMPADFVEAYNAVLGAVNNGNISEDRLNNAVGRILTAKGV